MSSLKAAIERLRLLGKEIWKLYPRNRWIGVVNAMQIEM